MATLLGTSITRPTEFFPERFKGSLRCGSHPTLFHPPTGGHPRTLLVYSLYYIYLFNHAMCVHRVLYYCVCIHPSYPRRGLFPCGSTVLGPFRSLLHIESRSWVQSTRVCGVFEPFVPLRHKGLKYLIPYFLFFPHHLACHSIWSTF